MKLFKRSVQLAALAAMLLAGAAMPLVAAPSGLVLAKFHADWCPSCKRWDRVSPGFAELKAFAEKKGIAVVVFDLTDDSSTEAARRQAVQLGIEKTFAAHEKGTGYALLIEGATGRVIDRLESGSANLLFLDSWFSEDAASAHATNLRKIEAALQAR